MNSRLTLTAATAVVLVSVALHPLFAAWTWFFEGAGAVIAVAAVGTATRLRTIPALLCLAAALLGVLLYLNLVFAGAQSLLLILPTPSSLAHLWWLAGQGMAESGRYAPPVPGLHGLLLLATAGIGLVAVLTDLLAVRLRSAALAGLPMLAIFTVPVATGVTRGSAGTAVVFCLGVTGYLAMLSADGRERLRLWGRVVTLWPADAGGHAGQHGQNARQAQAGSLPDTRVLAAAGRRVGLAATVLAICIPLFLPGLSVHKLFTGSGNAIGPGNGQSVQLPDPLAQMTGQLRRSQTAQVLTYHTTYPRGDYLQVYVLSYNAVSGTWGMTPPGLGKPVDNGRLPATPGLTDAGGITEQSTITLNRGLNSGSSVSFLPLFYPAKTVHVAGDWQADPRTLMVYSTHDHLSGLVYPVTSEYVDPSEQQLRQAPGPPADIARSYLATPAAYRSQLARIAQRVTASAASPYDKAVALQNWLGLSGTFSYNVTASEANSAAGLVRFLTVTKRGYCQQFAIAMAELARLLNIPSRVVVGYTPGTYVSTGDWQVKTSDAHAWPELYFQGAGWLRFEPTPTGTNGQGTASAPVYTLTLPAQGPGAGTGPALGGQVNPAPTAPGGANAGINARLNHLSGASGGGGKRASSSVLPTALTVILVLLALAFVAPRSIRSLTRRRRWLLAAGDAGRAHAAWRELRDDLADHGMRCPPNESPRAVARRVATRLGPPSAARDALDRIAMAEERARYSGKPASSGTLRADSNAVRRAIASSAGRPALWHARLFPSSAIAPLRAGSQNALDVFGWMDIASWRIRDRMARGKLSGERGGT